MTDWVGEASDYLRQVCYKNKANGFYVVFLFEEGHTESSMGSHPLISLEHLLTHVSATIAEDIAKGVRPDPIKEPIDWYCRKHDLHLRSREQAIAHIRSSHMEYEPDFHLEATAAKQEDSRA